LGPFCKLETLAINEERMPDNPSPAEKEQVLARETERLLAIIPAHSYVLVLDVVGKQLSSPELAARFDSLGLAGQSHLTFVIGGAFGFTDALRARADETISFSRLTFTHQMIRLLLLEQIYRAYKISRGEKYHW
ncbi:MAG: 23S rRNA (pseudouridine(1915)-N(3))-methyltransferase RlmH, partial [Acidaminococcaceae bacterium]